MLVSTIICPQQATYPHSRQFVFRVTLYELFATISTAHLIIVVSGIITSPLRPFTESADVSYSTTIPNIIANPVSRNPHYDRLMSISNIIICLPALLQDTLHDIPPLFWSGGYPFPLLFSW